MKDGQAPGLNRVVAVAAAAVCLVASLSLPAAARPAAAATAVNVPPAGRISGIDLQTYNDTSISPNFAQIAADGANLVNISVWWEVPSASSNTIVPAYPNTTITDVQLEQLARNAEAAGLQVAITPDFVVGTNTWRGSYTPPDPSTFFSNYTQMLDHYADIAQQLHMPMLWVGSEMINSEKYTSQWDSAIASVRQHYSGKLLYDVNWGTLDNVQFYGALNAMSISAYFPLSEQADPTLAQLMAAWQGANPWKGDWFAKIVGAEQRWQKPIYFGEAGYSYSTYAAEEPYAESYASSDPQLQYRCYQALDDTFRGQSWWGGVAWWAWDGGVYNMDGQPAESLIGAKNVAYPTVTGPSTGGSPSQAGSAGSSAATSGQPAGTAAPANGAAVSPSSAAGAVPVHASGSSATAPSATSASGAVGGASQQPASSPMKLNAAGHQRPGIKTALVVAGILLIGAVVALIFTYRKRGRLGRAPMRRGQQPTTS